MSRRALFLAGASCCWLLVTACGPTSLYHWGEYERQLHQTYSQEDKHAEYLYTVRELIAASDNSSRKVAPGLCLEYGVALYRAGYRDHALVFLDREQREWPESTVLVEKIIARVKQMKSAAPDGAADPREMYWLPGVKKPRTTSAESRKKGPGGRR